MAYRDLIAVARSARESAYAPYSGFRVGAALLDRDGRVYHGCNVENSSYGLSVCAEQTAFFSAISAGCHPGDFVALAVVGETAEPISPCGACRQVMAELGSAELVVLLATIAGAVRETTVKELLPQAFRLTVKAGSGQG